MSDFDIRNILEQLEKKFGPNARIRIFIDGSGDIYKDLPSEEEDKGESFHGIGELRSLLS